MIKENYKVALINAPAGYEAMLGDLPAGVTAVSEPVDGLDLIQVFVTSMRELEEQLPRLRSALRPGGLLWLTYPKGTSRIKTDLNRDIIWRYVEPKGSKAVAMIAVDDTWSAMRLKVV